MIRVLNILGSLDKGGLEISIMNCYRNINRTKIQFDFLLTSEKTDYYETEAISLGARIFRRPSQSKKPFGLGLHLHRVLKENPDINIIHIHHSSPKVAIDCAFAKLCKIPVRIVTSVNVWDLSFRRKKYRPLLRMLATHMLAVSIKSGISLFGKSAKSKIILSPPARDLEPFRYSQKKRDKKRHELGLNEKMTVLICVANIKIVKNQTFLLDVLKLALKKDSNILLLIVGFSSDSVYFDELVSKSEKLEVKDSVKFLGLRDDVPELLFASDMFLMPSFHEGLPGAAIEAQATGLRCLISSNITSEVKIIDEVEFLPIDKGPEIWAEHVLSYKKSQRVDKVEELRRAGYEILDEVKKLENLYITALREKGL